MRSSTRRTTRSFASWSNFLGIFQIFPSTQTEQNLGHFMHWWNTKRLHEALDYATPQEVETEYYLTQPINTGP
ncbi:hypothetical protein A9D03_12825 [Corynebacterium striatum]|nr:hypothetical protein [Corynebacterium striatum]